MENENAEVAATSEVAAATSEVAVSLIDSEARAVLRDLEKRVFALEQAHLSER